MSTVPVLRRLSETVLPEISAAARLHYRPENPLSYHGYDHVGDTKAYLWDITSELDDLHAKIDVIAGLVTLEYHDAKYWANHEELGFKTKEALSADVAGKDLRKLHIVEDDIRIVQSGTLATHIDGVPVTNTEKAVRLADVGNVADKEFPFLRNLILFAQDEIQMGRDVPQTFLGFCQRSKNFLGKYYDEPLLFETVDGSFVVLEDRMKAAKRNLDSLESLDLREVLAFTGLTLPSELNVWFD